MIRTPTAHTFAVLTLSVVFVAVACSGATAADIPVVSIDFEQTPVADAFQALKRFDPSLSYAFSEGAAEHTVTASLVEVPLPEAIKIIAEHSGLTVRQENGVYRIDERPRPPVDEGYGPARGFTTAPWADEFMTGSHTTVATGAPATGSGSDEDRILRMIEVKHADPALLAELFGGYAIYGGDTGYSGGVSGRSGVRGYGDTGYSRDSTGYNRGYDRSSRGYDGNSGGYTERSWRY